MKLIVFYGTHNLCVPMRVSEKMLEIGAFKAKANAVGRAIANEYGVTFTEYKVCEFSEFAPEWFSGNYEELDLVNECEEWKSLL